MNKKCVVLSHSGYGHTQRLADQIIVGVNAISGIVAEPLHLSQGGDLPAGGWDLLEDAEGIIFGCPTFMGGPSWQFKKFCDATREIREKELWRDKLAAGFTNSRSIHGDKFLTISYFITFAMQHAMIWVGAGLKAANTLAATRNDINYLGSFSGLVSQVAIDAPLEGGLPEGDLRTARHFGRRYGTVLASLS